MVEIKTKKKEKGQEKKYWRVKQFLMSLVFSWPVLEFLSK